jgi:hypothetical protein
MICLRQDCPEHVGRTDLRRGCTAKLHSQLRDNKESSGTGLLVASSLNLPLKHYRALPRLTEYYLDVFNHTESFYRQIVNPACRCLKF